MTHHRFALARALLVVIIAIAVALFVESCWPGDDPASTPAPTGAIDTPITGTPEPTPTSQAPSPSPTVAPTPPSTPAPTVAPSLPPTSTELSSFESRHFLWHLNIARATLGLEYLRRDPALDAIARTRTAALVRCGCLQHDISYVAAHARYRTVGEILGWTSWPEPKAHAWLVAAFLGSPVHRAVILGTWSRFGSSVVTTPDGRTFVTVLFGRP